MKKFVFLDKKKRKNIRDFLKQNIEDQYHYDCLIVVNEKNIIGKKKVKHKLISTSSLDLFKDKVKIENLLLKNNENFTSVQLIQFSLIQFIKKM